MNKEAFMGRNNKTCPFLISYFSFVLFRCEIKPLVCLIFKVSVFASCFNFQCKLIYDTT